MPRDELTLAIAGALIGAMALGWIVAGVMGRLNARPGAEARALAARLREAEARLAEAEAGQAAAEASAVELQARLRAEAAAEAAQQ